MRLILGDCLEKMKELPDKSVDCFVADKMGLDAIGIEKNEAFYNKANEVALHREAS
jgi:DNA modification methylase